MDADRLGRPSIAGLYRDFGRDWEIGALKQILTEYVEAKYAKKEAAKV